MNEREAEPNGENANEAELLVAMEAAPNKRSYRRLAGLRALLMGFPTGQVAKLFGRSERMVRLWVAMFNAGGIDALTTKARGGRPRKVKLQRLRDLVVPVLEDPSQAGQFHWTGVKLHGWLQEQLALELGYRTVIRYLHELDYHLRVPQRWPERQNQEERAAFLTQLQALREDPRVELWYGDECGVEGDPRPRRRWSERGEPPARAVSRGSRAHQCHRQRLSGHRRVCHHDLRWCGYRCLPVLPRSSGCVRATRSHQAAHPHSRQRFLAQSSPAALAPFRVSFPSALQPGLQSHRTLLASPQG